MKKAARITSKGQITVPHNKLLFEKVRPVRTKSPFEKYRGIGSPGIAHGKKAVVRWVRERRGR